MPRTTCKRKVNKSKSKNKNNKSIKRSRKLRYKLRKLKGGAYFPEKDIQDDLTDDKITTIALILLQLCTTIDNIIDITQKEYELINKVNILKQLATKKLATNKNRYDKYDKYYLHKHNSKESRYEGLNTPQFIYELDIDSRIKTKLSDFIYQENNNINNKKIIDDGFIDIEDDQKIYIFDENGDEPYKGY